jgi:hypothetical protein
MESLAQMVKKAKEDERLAHTRRILSTMTSLMAKHGSDRAAAFSEMLALVTAEVDSLNAVSDE